MGNYVEDLFAAKAEEQRIIQEMQTVREDIWAMMGEATKIAANIRGGPVVVEKMSPGYLSVLPMSGSLETKMNFTVDKYVELQAARIIEVNKIAAVTGVLSTFSDGVYGDGRHAVLVRSGKVEEIKVLT
jgi:hypothetical protein